MRLPDLSVCLQALGLYYALEGRVQTTSSTGGFDSHCLAAFFLILLTNQIVCDKIILVVNTALNHI